MPDHVFSEVMSPAFINGSKWLSSVTRFLSRLPVEESKRLQRLGVQALVFGKAAVCKRGQQYATRTELDGFQIKVKSGPKEKQHNGTHLFVNDRVETGDDDEAIVVFVDDFSTIRVQKNSVVVIYKKSAGLARRKTFPARLERGTLKRRLSELDGR